VRVGNTVVPGLHLLALADLAPGDSTSLRQHVPRGRARPLHSNLVLGDYREKNPDRKGKCLFMPAGRKYESNWGKVKNLKDVGGESKRSKPGMRAGDELLSEIVERSPIATFVIDRNHVVTHWNHACEKLTGIDAEKVIGTNKQWSAFYPEQRPVMADLVVDGALADETAKYYGDQYRKSEVIEDAYEAEGFFPRIGHEGKWLFFNAAPLKNAQGDIIGALETLQDLSAHKLAEKKLLENEERYRAVLEALPDSVVVYDMKGKAVYVNPAFSRVFGWQPVEILGKKIDYVPENNRAETDIMIDKVLAGESFSGIETQRYSKKKKMVDVSISAAIYLDREGNPAGSAHILRDISEHKKLQARAKEGERLLALQKDLKRRNKKLAGSNEKLRQAYAIIEKDLKAGAKIQSSLIPRSATVISEIRFDSIFLPSSYVAGDIYNYFRLDEHYIGFYVLDVAGHGIPAALLSVTLSRALSPDNHEDCPLKQFLPSPEPPYYRLINPAMVVQALNTRFQADPDTMQYFTMIYGMIDTRDGATVMTMAGHPAPILVKKQGPVTPIGSGGYPVGLLPDVNYEEEGVHLDKGDRLILYSDGITECKNNQGKQFSLERLSRLMKEGQDLDLEELMTKTKERLRRWRGNREFEDDVTLLAIERM
jgi:phosphoserine phosphatase RsbU/P